MIKKKKKSHKKNQVNEEVLEAGNHSADAVPTLFKKIFLKKS